MSITVGPRDPLEDAAVREVVLGAFRRDGELRLVEELARRCPTFDPALSLLAEARGRAAGYALFLPRELRMRGTWLRCAVLSPLAVAPAHQGRGVARRLVEQGLELLRERGFVACAVLGAPDLYARFGFRPAFDVHRVSVPADALPGQGEDPRWRAVRGEDLAPLAACYERCYAEGDGIERRSLDALDWDSLAPGSHTLVWEDEGAARAYVRFRVWDELELTECGAEGPEGVTAILHLARRLAREHGKLRLEVHVAPPHPLARALLAAGGTYERDDFGGAAMLRVLDWPALWSAIDAHWTRALRGAGLAELSVEIEGRTWRLSAGEGAREAQPGAAERLLSVPAQHAPALLSGRMEAAELLFDPAVAARSRLDAAGRAAAHALFSPAPAQWTWSPIYEVAEA